MAESGCFVIETLSFGTHNKMFMYKWNDDSKGRRGENRGVNRRLLLEPVGRVGSTGGEGWYYSLYFCRSWKFSRNENSDYSYQSFPLPILRIRHKSKHTWAGTMIPSTPQTVYTEASEQRSQDWGAAALLRWDKGLTLPALGLRVRKWSLTTPCFSGNTNQIPFPGWGFFSFLLKKIRFSSSGRGRGWGMGVSKGVIAGFWLASTQTQCSGVFGRQQGD